jgi:uncharacterized membrane protein YfcA
MHVVAVILIATLIRSTFGFGEALFAVPLLALRIPVQVAAPLAVLVSIAVAAIVVAQDWRQIHARSATGLVLATAAGIPLGLWMLTSTSESVVKRILALVIISFSLYSLFRPPLRASPHGLAWMIGCGFFAGILGGAYGMNGPPLVVYGSLRGWSPQQFRATLQGYFLPASLIGLCGYWLKGLWTPAVTRYFLLSLPITLVATLIGRALNRRLAGGNFFRYLYVGLIGVGLVLIGQSFWG